MNAEHTALSTQLPRKVLIAAGGTGGHIIPALAVANYLRTKGVVVHWLGTQGGLEQQLVPAAGIVIHTIAFRGIRKKGWLSLLLAPFRVLRATSQTIKILRREQITAVVGFGGFVSFPGGLAACLLRKPLIIQEQNAVAGFANRFLAHYARQVFQAFPHTFPHKRRVITSGNPVRDEIANLPEPSQRFSGRSGPLCLLILGGSQGAMLFNQLIPQALAKIPPPLRPHIIHAAGKRFAEQTAALYRELGVDAEVSAFIDDIAASYAWADLAICRAGALTVTELAAAGLASVLIPYPHAVDDHQTKNAAGLVEVEAAIALAQQEFTIEKFQALLLELNDRARLLKMAKAARSLALPHATEIVAQGCLDYCK